MDLTLLCADKEEVLLIFVEVEAHTASEAIDERLFLAVSKFLVFVDDKLQLDDLLWLKFVLHEVPESDAAVRRDREEAKILAFFVLLPTYLPNRVCMFVSPHIRLIDGLVGALLSDIKDHDASIVATSCD